MSLQKIYALLAADHARTTQNGPAPLLKTGALVTDRGQTRTWTQARYVENIFQSGYLLERITEKAPTGTDALDPDVPEQTVEILGEGKLHDPTQTAAILAAQDNGFKMRATYSLQGWWHDADNPTAAGQLFTKANASQKISEKPSKSTLK